MRATRTRLSGTRSSRTRRSSRTSSSRTIVVACYVCYLLVLLSRIRHRVHATLFMYKVILTLYNILEIIVECPQVPPFIYPWTSSVIFFRKSVPKCFSDVGALPLANETSGKMKLFTSHNPRSNSHLPTNGKWGKAPVV